MNKTTKKIILNYVLGPILLVLLLTLIYRQVSLKGSFEQEWNAFKARWGEGNSALLGLVILLAPANWLLEAWKWQCLLRKIEPIPFVRAVASILSGISFGMVTPGRLGDFAGRILYLKNEAKLRGAIATLTGNIAQTLVTFLCGITGLIYFNIYDPGTWQLIALIGALSGAALLFYFYLRIEVLALWVARFPKLRSLAIAFRVLKRYSRKDLILILWISLLRFVVYNFQFLILMNVFGAGIPWQSGMLLTSLMFWLLTVIPSLFIADIGVRGFVAGLIFVDTGIAANSVAVLAGSYAIWFLNLVVPALIGSGLLLTVRIFR